MPLCSCDEWPRHSLPGDPRGPDQPLGLAQLLLSTCHGPYFVLHCSQLVTGVS